MASLCNNTKQDSLKLAFESVDSCFEYVEYITSKIQLLIGYYNVGELDHANDSLIEVVDLMDLYVQLISKVYHVIRVDLQEVFLKDESILKLEIHLLSVLKAILIAKEKDDIIMLRDLLEYELIDNLTQWKIKVLPELKKLKKI